MSRQVPPGLLTLCGTLRWAQCYCYARYGGTWSEFAMPEYPSGTVAFLFTDIEGSTRRWERDAEAMWAVVERHFTLLGEAIAAQNGVLFKTIGDAVQAAFPTAPAAVAAAVAAQSAL